jgi:hypothetical protein
MSDINQNVNINVNANTQDAGKDISKLENNIKTLDGAINLVGGSIEVLAGSLALTGAVTEEQAQRFETAAVGAIALADGSKRIIEGYKTLATETKVLTVIQRIYNTVMKANPLFLIVGVIAAVTLGVIALTKALKDQADEQERLNKLQSDEATLGFLERQVKLSKAREDSIVTTATLELQAAQKREELAKDAIATAEDVDEARQKYYNARTDREIAEINLIKAKQKVEDDAAEAEKKRLEDLETERQKQLALRKTAVEEEKKLEQEAFDEFEKNYNKRIAKEKELTQARINADVARAKAAKDARDAEVKAEEAAAAFKEQAITGGIDNIQGALGALFQENKAVASANVLIDAAQAGVGIIKNSQSTGPLAIAYQASQFALLAATTIASLQQINSAEPGSSDGAPSTPRPNGLPTTGTTPGLSGPGFNLGVPQLGGTSGVNTLSAVVLAGDVTSAQAQNAAIRNRRRFG